MAPDAKPDAQQRKRTLWLFAASIVVALVVVGVAIALSQGGGDDQSSGGGGSGSSASKTTAPFEGIPQHEARLGKPDAPLRMVEFIDLQCPFCAQYSREILPTLVKRYVRPGQLSIELRPLTFLGDDSVRGAKAVASAATQNRAWQFSELFYANQGAENSGYVTPAFLRKIARGAGVSPQQAVVAADSPIVPPLLTLAAKEEQRYGIDSTPSFLLAPRGQALKPLTVNSLTLDEFTGPIDSALGQ
jgi:protein-disulfide isomerase